MLYESLSCTDRVYLDSEARAANHTHHLYHQLHATDLSVFPYLRLKKKQKTSVQDMSECLVALLPLPSRQQIII